VTCANWDVCSCCSAEPLYKCLLPTATKAFAPECSSPIDARQQCCGDAFTHERTTDIEEAILSFAANTTAVAQSALAETNLDEQIVKGVTNGIQATREFVETQHNPCADLSLLTDAQKADC